MGLIFEAGRASTLILCILFAYICYQKYDSTTPKTNEHEFVYHKQTISFNSIWDDNQFQQLQKSYIPISYKINQSQLSMTLASRHINQNNPLKVSLTNLQLQVQDLSHIQQISLLPTASSNYQILLIQSKYYSIIYNIKNNLICYEKIHFSKNQQIYFLDSKGRIWIVGFPNYNIVLARVYGTEQRGLIWSGRVATKQKIQMLANIQQKNGQIKVKFLTFSRNYVVYQIGLDNFKMGSFEIINSHSFNSLINHISDFQISLSNKIKQIEQYQSIQQFIYQLSFGRFGKKKQQKIQRQIQEEYEFQAMDCQKNIVVEFNNSYKSASLVSFDQVLIPLRTPVFVSKQAQDQLLPFEEVLNKSRFKQQLPNVDFKLYGIKNKNLQVMRGQAGLYRLLPDSSVHFVTFDNRFFNFYPKENVNQNDYYIVRTAKGGIALKQNKVKGIFQEVPVPNQNAVELKYGYSKQQIYHELMTQGNQLAPGLYEAHIIQKGLFVKTYKNRLELISNLNGKSAFTHYLNKKQNYLYSTSFIENNQFWIFQHKNGSNALITKYELFINSSNPKTMLSIKRNYQFDIKGRIVKIQKCIDYFYYINYITEDNRYGIARIHHVLMSNRQARADGNYAGAFEKMMVIPNIQRGDKIKVLPIEQELLKAQFDIGQQIVKNWKQLQLKHQFRILPIRIYSFGNDYYVFNIRKMMLTAFDSELQKVSSDLYLKGFIASAGLGLILAVFVLLSKSEKQTEGNIKKDKIQSPTKDRQNQKKKKKQ